MTECCESSDFMRIVLWLDVYIDNDLPWQNVTSLGVSWEWFCDWIYWQWLTLKECCQSRGFMRMISRSDMLTTTYLDGMLRVKWFHENSFVIGFINDLPWLIVASLKVSWEWVCDRIWLTLTECCESSGFMRMVLWSETFLASMRLLGMWCACQTAAISSPDGKVHRIEGRGQMSGSTTQSNSASARTKTTAVWFVYKQWRENSD